MAKCVGRNGHKIVAVQACLVGGLGGTSRDNLQTSLRLYADRKYAKSRSNSPSRTPTYRRILGRYA
jgi:hypothetical protein